MVLGRHVSREAGAQIVIQVDTARIDVLQGDKSKGQHVISTENSAEDARKHYLDLDDTDLNFSEKIYTFNYRPGTDSWAALTKEKTWINEQGKQSMQFLK